VDADPEVGACGVLGTGRGGRDRAAGVARGGLADRLRCWGWGNRWMRFLARGLWRGRAW
jgi:hypothetical protein